MAGSLVILAKETAIDVTKIGWGRRDWIDLAQDRNKVNKVRVLRESLNIRKF
jgi:hypothetical protein